MRRKPLGSMALLGADVISEQGAGALAVEALEPIQNPAGQPLRFALMARADRLAQVKAKIKANEPLSMGTAYPVTMAREMQALNIAMACNNGDVVAGKVEKMLYEQERGLDAIFEQVQSGDSARAMGLTVLIDYLAPVDLVRVVK